MPVTTGQPESHTAFRPNSGSGDGSQNVVTSKLEKCSDSTVNVLSDRLDSSLAENSGTSMRTPNVIEEGSQNIKALQDSMAMIETLMEKNEMQEDQLQRKDAALQQAENTISKLRESLKEKETELNSLAARKKSQDDVKNEIKDAQTQLMSLKLQQTAVEDAVKRLKEKKQFFETHVKKLEDSKTTELCATYFQELKSAMEMVQEALNDKETRDSELEELIGKINEAKVELSKIHKEQEEVENVSVKLKQLKDNFSTVSQVCTMKEKQRVEREQKVEELQKKITQLKEELQSNQRQIDGKINDMASLDAELQEKGIQLTKQTETLNGNLKSQEQIEAANKTMLEKNEALDKEKTKLEESIAQLKRDYLHWLKHSQTKNKLYDDLVIKCFKIKIHGKGQPPLSSLGSISSDTSSGSNFLSPNSASTPCVSVEKLSQDDISTRAKKQLQYEENNFDQFDQTLTINEMLEEQINDSTNQTPRTRSQGLGSASSESGGKKRKSSTKGGKDAKVPKQGKAQSSKEDSKVLGTGIIKQENNDPSPQMQELDDIRRMQIRQLYTFSVKNTKKKDSDPKSKKQNLNHSMESDSEFVGNSTEIGDGIALTDVKNKDKVAEIEAKLLVAGHKFLNNHVPFRAQNQGYLLSKLQKCSIAISKAQVGFWEALADSVEAFPNCDDPVTEESVYSKCIDYMKNHSEEFEKVC